MSEGPTDRPRLSWTYGCPFCGTPVRTLADACSYCALPLQDARAIRVAAIDAGLIETGQRRATLMAE
ncbi:MAG: hypothetical protein QOG52_298, partial [Frankiaceae bacterium]|nr:hypothetical protein [Frankiaceae bacterium]